MLTGVIITMATIAAMLVMYFGARAFLGGEQDDRTVDLAHSVLFRTSALHGLVLALVFASEMVEYHQLDYEIAVEVNAISDVYYDAERYVPPQTRCAQRWPIT